MSMTVGLALLRFVRAGAVHRSPSGGRHALKRAGGASGNEELLVELPATLHPSRILTRVSGCGPARSGCWGWFPHRCSPSGAHSGPLSRPPASIACIGGLLANNSGGMRCGPTPTHSTVNAMKLVLGQRGCDRHGAPGRRSAFRRRAAPDLAAGLEQLRDELALDHQWRTDSAASSRSNTPYGCARFPGRRPRWRFSVGWSLVLRAPWLFRGPRRSFRPLPVRPHAALGAGVL